MVSNEYWSISVHQNPTRFTPDLPLQDQWDLHEQTLTRGGLSQDHCKSLVRRARTGLKPGTGMAPVKGLKGILPFPWQLLWEEICPWHQSKGFWEGCWRAEFSHCCTEILITGPGKPVPAAAACIQIYSWGTRARAHSMDFNLNIYRLTSTYITSMCYFCLCNSTHSGPTMLFISHFAWGA